MCKITERLTYYLDSRNLRSKYQSGFRKGRGTMDPIACLEAEVMKAQVNNHQNEKIRNIGSHV